jgi:hypothetical protein
MTKTIKFVVRKSKGDWVRIVVQRHWLEHVEFEVRRVWYFWREFTVTGPEESLRLIEKELAGYVRINRDLMTVAML